MGKELLFQKRTPRAHQTEERKLVSYLQVVIRNVCFDFNSRSLNGHSAKGIHIL